jgi:hypothetical protein
MAALLVTIICSERTFKSVGMFKPFDQEPTIKFTMIAGRLFLFYFVKHRLCFELNGANLSDSQVQ